MTDIEKLLAIEAIKQLKARYFRCMDTKDFDGLAETFAPDACFSARSPKSRATGTARLADFTVTGRKDIMEKIMGRVLTAEIMHHGHMPEIEILSHAEARGVVAMESSHWVMAEGRATAIVRSFGYYYDTYTCAQGRWQVQTSELVLIRADSQPWHEPAPAAADRTGFEVPADGSIRAD